MATTSRHTNLFGIEDWKTFYQTYKEADFQSFNFETLRKTFVDYLQQHHPESFNDFIESSEFVAYLDLLAFMGQSLSFRNDLNMRENFLDTAERTDSVNKLAELVGYSPKRNEAASGFLKIVSVSTTEALQDYNQNNLTNKIIKWNDKTNTDWQEQFNVIINSVLVNSQKIGNPGNSAAIVGINTDEYTINMIDGYLPVVPFSSVVDGTSVDFEIVNGTSVNKSYIYEPLPNANKKINILYRNDNQGFASANTGFFFHFKQGSLKSYDFQLADLISNTTVDVPTKNVNAQDVWLINTDNGLTTEWDIVENIFATNLSQTETKNKKYFSVSNRSNDQISLTFGDGVFSQIPIGKFTAITRSSNGQQYVINTNELQAINVSIKYISKAGREETVSFVLSLTQSVSNATNTENLDDIKRRAPARFYTQNRMVNGEDYNNFPYTNFGTIIKSKSVNRSNIGASRYLDLVDPTGKYSNIDTFGADGVLYKELTDNVFTFTFNDRIDIQTLIVNQIEPILSSKQLTHFYYNQFSRQDVSSLNLSWNMSTTFTNETTGYFKTSAGTPAAIGAYTPDDKQYLIQGSLVKFTAPFGMHYSSTNKLLPGTPSQPGDKIEIWAQIQTLVLDGTNYGVGNLNNGSGPITLNNYVPNGSIPTTVILPYNTTLPINVIQSLTPEFELNRNFGLGFNHITNTWYIITHNNIDLTGTFNAATAQDTTNTNSDSSWLIKFESVGKNSYQITSKELKYFFASVAETRFFYDRHQQIYNTRTGKIVNDYIKILNINNKPDSHTSLDSNIVTDIIGQSVESDGFVNDFNVEVSFADLDSDGVIDNPDFFETFVNSAVNVTNKYVFFRLTTDFDNLERWLPVANNVINTSYSDKIQINIAKDAYAVGQEFYAFNENIFYIIASDGVTTYVQATDTLRVRVGRGDIKFQYKHNSPSSRRINPGTSNIIDIYVVTSSYYNSYIRYIQDNTNTILEPAIPTTTELHTDYNSLNDFKMQSDNIVLNSVKFKPLFGSKADTSLQATIKVVKFATTTVSDSEIKSKVILAINMFFDINNWDFGATFYFSELSAYLHSTLGNIVGSIVITPKDTTKTFGDLYEIKSQPNEIFMSSATVNEVEIVSSLTASKLQLKAI